ncbi:hypothetical protein OA856_00990 [Pelagibacteraceae bacterium]|nr:hypothetical protein [Pelagibacteraceae bacterium]
MKINKFKDILLTFKGILRQKKIQNFEKYSLEEIEEYKIKKIKKLLINASREISYYRDLFWNIGFDPSTFSKLSDLEQIPLLNKSIVKNNYSNLISGKRTKGSIQLTTSGTTGERLYIYTSPKQWIIEQAAIWRHWKIAGYKFRDRMVIIRSYSPKKNENFYSFNKFKNWLYVSPYHLDDTYLEILFKLLQQWKPKFLRGYPSSIYLLARYSIKHNLNLDFLKAIFTASEKLTKEYREVIERAFKVKIFDHYGQAEITVMFHEWNDHAGLNNLEYYGHVELVETSKPKIYSIIATNLHNDVMPLIRYDTGDLVRINDEDKSDTRCNFLNVSEIIGRSHDFLKNADGGLIPSINFYTYFANIKEIIRFQFVVNGENIDLMLKIDKEARKKDVIEIVTLEMKERFRKKINVIDTEDFYQNNEGKFSAIVNIA